jgi:hypothetical protein
MFLFIKIAIIEIRTTLSSITSLKNTKHFSEAIYGYNYLY